jgi:hypothetical protein
MLRMGQALAQAVAQWGAAPKQPFTLYHRTARLNGFGRTSLAANRWSISL